MRTENTYKTEEKIGNGRKEGREGRRERREGGEGREGGRSCNIGVWRSTQ